MIHLAPDDFIATTITNVELSSENNEVCVEFRIVDDDIALEGDEVFRVSFDIKSSNTTATPGDRPTTTVTIEDDDGMMSFYSFFVLIVIAVIIIQFQEFLLNRTCTTAEKE